MISVSFGRRYAKSRGVASSYLGQTEIHSNWRYGSPILLLRFQASIPNAILSSAQSNRKGRMKRTFNYTGRRKIARKDLSFVVKRNSDGWWFDAELKLAEYRFPRNAEVWIEAHRQNLWMQWS